jgi:hypothetical protein
LGRLNFTSGDIYDGFLENGVFEGEGIYYSKETNSYVFGNFSKNSLVSTLHKGEGFPRETVGK